MISEYLTNELIQEGESRHLEFKETVQQESVAKTVCGFLNADGGRILIGISETKDVIGITITEKEILDLETFLLRNILPDAPISVSKEIVDDKNILSIDVPNGSQKPYIFKNSIFLRVGPITQQASPKDISTLIQRRQQAEIRWERQSVLGADLDDLDQEEISRTILIMNETGRGFNQANDLIDFLSRYGLHQNGNISNAAIVLFGKEPAKFLPQCRVRITMFNTGKTDSSFEFDRLLEGNLFKNVAELQNILTNNIGIKSEFTESSWQRRDTFEYPIQALREGILNALIHRDYSNVSGSVLIGIYPDKLEISNYGELPIEYKVNDLRSNHLSLPRNPDIAHIAFLRGLIEKLGRGTLKIIEECKKAGLSDPKWQSKSGITTLTFYKARNTPITGQVERLNERQIRLTREIKSGQSITVTDYLALIGSTLTERSARNDLAILVQDNWFKKQGLGRNTVYVRTEKV